MKIFLKFIFLAAIFYNEQAQSVKQIVYSQIQCAIITIQNNSSFFNFNEITKHCQFQKTEFPNMKYALIREEKRNYHFIVKHWIPTTTVRPEFTSNFQFERKTTTEIVLNKCMAILYIFNNEIKLGELECSSWEKDDVCFLLFL